MGVAACFPVVGLAVGLLSSCGNSSQLTTLAVSTQVINQTGSQGRSEPVAQGTVAEVQMTVTNTGQSAVRGVTVRMSVPSGFVYTSTASLVESGDSVRASDVTPASHDSTLTWGSWTIGPGAPGQASQVVITANLEAAGNAGSVQAAPLVYATGYANALTGRPVTLEITPAPSLSLVLHVSPASTTAGSDVVYQAVITNTGSGSAGGASLAITLPSDFDYVTTDSVAGNASTSGASYPVVGSVIPTWAGFDIPGRSGSGPGILSISFEVQILADVGRGIYLASAGLVASNGSPTQNDLQLNYGALAPVTVTGP